MKQNKKNLLSIFVFSHTLLMAIYMHSATAQVCNTKEITPSISPKNFTYNEINNIDSTTNVGVVTATATASTIKTVPGLVWNRCVYGQKWDSVTLQCIGSPILLTWPEALKEAAKMQSIIDGSIWRLPNIKELNSILDLQCVNPPYNLEVFPDTFASESHGLWTSSPYIDGNNPTPGTEAWYIDLSLGRLNHRDIGDSIATKNFVRFVK